MRHITPICVSAKRIQAAFGCDAETAFMVRAKMRAGYNVGRFHWGFGVAAYVESVASVLNCDAQSLFGETLADGRDGDTIFYVNVGDPYQTTLIFDYDKDRWTLACWGDLF